MPMLTLEEAIETLWYTVRQGLLNPDPIPDSHQRPFAVRIILSVLAGLVGWRRLSDVRER